MGMVLGALIVGAIGVLYLPWSMKEASFFVGLIVGLSLVLLAGILVFRFKGTPFNSTGEERKQGVKAGNWIVLSAAILMVVLTCSFVIFKQNESSRAEIQLQRELLKEQEELNEITRKGSVVILMGNLLDKIEAELGETPDRTLSEATITRISSLSSALEPLRYLEGDSLSEKRYSLERGQFLIALLKMNIDSSSFDKIKRKTSFAGAELSGANLRKVDLSGAELRWANLKQADLSESDVSEVDLRGANLVEANVRMANLSRTDLKRADMRWADMNGANMQWAEMNGANMRAANLRGAELGNASMKWADVSDAFLNEANVQRGNLLGAIFQRANLSGANLRESDLRRADLSEANLVGTQLNKAKMQVAILSKAIVDQEKWIEKLTEWEVAGAKGHQAKYKTVDDASSPGTYWLQNLEK